MSLNNITATVQSSGCPAIAGSNPTNPANNATAGNTAIKAVGKRLSKLIPTGLPEAKKFATREYLFNAETEITQGSGVDYELFAAAVAFLPAVAPNKADGLPLADALNWGASRRRPRTYPDGPQIAYAFAQEAGGFWQAKLRYPLPDKKGTAKNIAATLGIDLAEVSEILKFKGDSEVEAIAARHGAEVKRAKYMARSKFSKHNAAAAKNTPNPAYLPPVSVATWVKFARLNDIENYLPQWVTESAAVSELAKISHTGDLLPADTTPVRSRGIAYQPINTSSFHQWIELLPFIPAAITEGGKKALAALCAGVYPLSLYGHSSGHAPKPEGNPKAEDVLIPDLARFAKHERPIVIAMDEDAPEAITTRANVAGGVIRLAEMFAAQKCPVSVAVHGYKQGKGLDDFIVKNGPEAFREMIAAAEPYGTAKARLLTEKAKGWGYGRKRADNPGLYGLTCDRAHIEEGELIQGRYLPPLKLGAAGSITALSAPIGGGKTESVKSAKAEAKTKHGEDSIFDVIGYRNGLGMQTAKRLGGAHIHDFTIRDSFGKMKRPENYTPQEAAQRAKWIAAQNNLSYCLDSLHVRQGFLYSAIAEGRKITLFVDEADAVVKHLLTGGTLKDRRAEVADDFAGICAAVLQAGGNIVLAEADLSQVTVDYFAEISGAAHIEAIESAHNPRPRRVHLYESLNLKGEPSDSMAGKMNAVKVLELLETGERVGVCSDAAEWLEKLHIAIKEAGRKSILIAREMLHLPEVREFLKNPDAAIKAHDYQAVLISPTAESGISITDPRFKTVTLYGGHLESRALIQFPGRFRHAEELHAFIKQRSRTHNEESTPLDASAVLKDWEQTANDSRLALGFAMDSAIAPGAQSSFFASPLTKGEIHHRYAAIFQARANLSKADLRAEFSEACQRHGDRVELTTMAAADYYSEETEQYTGAAQAFNEAREIWKDNLTAVRQRADITGLTADAANKILKSSRSNPEERARAAKFFLLENYPALPVNDAKFIKEEWITRRLSSVRAHGFGWLMRNQKIAKLLDLQSWEAQAGNVFLWLPSIKAHAAQAETFAVRSVGAGIPEDLRLVLGFAEELTNKTPLQLLEALTEMECYSNRTPEARLIQTWASLHAPMITRLFTLNIKSSDSPVTTTQKLLRRIGYKQQMKGRPKGEGRSRPRTYKAVAMAYQGETFASLDQRWADELAQENTHSQQAVSTVFNSETTTEKGGQSPLLRDYLAKMYAMKSLNEAMAYLETRQDAEGNLSVPQTSDTEAMKLTKFIAALPQTA